MPTSYNYQLYLPSGTPFVFILLVIVFAPLVPHVLRIPLALRSRADSSSFEACLSIAIDHSTNASAAKELDPSVIAASKRHLTFAVFTTSPSEGEALFGRLERPSWHAENPTVHAEVVCAPYESALERQNQAEVVPLKLVPLV